MRHIPAHMCVLHTVTVEPPPPHSSGPTTRSEPTTHVLVLSIEPPPHVALHSLLEPYLQAIVYKTKAQVFPLEKFPKLHRCLRLTWIVRLRVARAVLRQEKYSFFKKAYADAGAFYIFYIKNKYPSANLDQQAPCGGGVLLGRRRQRFHRPNLLSGAAASARDEEGGGGGGRQREH